MAEVNEVRGSETYILARLNANATLVGLVGDRIYRGKAPESATLPFVLFSFVAGVDRLGADATRVFTRPIYLVKAVGSGDAPEATADIATEIDKALHKAPASVPVAGLQVMGCHRLELVNFEEDVNGVRYYHIGGQYRLFVHDNP